MTIYSLDVLLFLFEITSLICKYLQALFNDSFFHRKFRDSWKYFFWPFLWKNNCCDKNYSFIISATLLMVLKLIRNSYFNFLLKASDCWTCLIQLINYGNCNNWGLKMGVNKITERIPLMCTSYLGGVHCYFVCILPYSTSCIIFLLEIETELGCDIFWVPWQFNQKLS